MTTTVSRLTWDDKLALIRARARRAGFRRHDLEDAVQDMALVLLEFQYDPDAARGASEATVLTTIVDRRLQSLRRGARRYARLKERVAERGATPHAPASDSEPLDDRLVAWLATLDDDARHVCELLRAGVSLAGVVERLGLSRHRVSQILDALRTSEAAAVLDLRPAE